ncbi:2Fe-2S iron-sulfur cluster binding domain-containing protein [bacterium]|nr:2Fe-2S iron-sulfur cluster binding domain-containing protein [bacterium]
MKSEMLEKMEGYQEVIQEIHADRKYGADFLDEKGAVKNYINRIHPGRIDLKVTDIFDETRTTKTLRFSAIDGYLPPFQAGQYISLFTSIGNIKTARPYSISSSPTERGYWDITVRAVENGLVSNYLLNDIRAGDNFVSSGPQGQFCHNPLFHDNHLVFLAGGSGITPFLSMIREVSRKGINRTIVLLYGSRTTDEAICHEELNTLAKKSPSIKYFPVIEQPEDTFDGLTGFITADVISEATGGIDGKTFYICGPQAMYDFCVQQLESLNVPKRKIRREMYGVPVNIWETDGWPEDVDRDNEVTISINGEKIATSKSSETLISVLEKTGHIIPSICRCGECSMCRVKLLNGKVYQPPGSLVRKSDRQFGFIHACASYPLTDVDICP